MLYPFFISIFLFFSIINGWFVYKNKEKYSKTHYTLPIILLMTMVFIYSFSFNSVAINEYIYLFHNYFIKDTISLILFIKCVVLILYSFSLLFLYYASYYDYKEKEIFDSYTVPILIFGLLASLFNNNFEYQAYTITFIIAIRYIGALIFGKEVFGEADIIVYGGIAAFYSLKEMVILYLLSCVIGIILGIFLKVVIKDENWKEIPMLPPLFISIYLLNIILYLGWLS